jgi:HEAT repeat protein
MDDVSTPLHHVISTLGELKERRAIPGLTSLIGRQQGNDYYAASALGKIGDLSVGPFLLRMYLREYSLFFGDALGVLRYRPAVPALVDRLNQSTNTYEGTRILENLLEIGDATAIPEMEKYVKSLTPEDQRAQKAGARILAQMRDNDPVAVLLKMFDDEQYEHEKIDLLRDLGRHRDPRAIDRLFAVAVSSDSTLFRGNAIRTLSRMQDRPALLALVSIMETNAPPPTQFDKLAILDGRPPDYSKREAARALREATHLKLGENPEAWRRWILENR